MEIVNTQFLTNMNGTVVELNVLSREQILEFLTLDDNSGDRCPILSIY